MSVADQRGPHFDTPTGTLNFYDNGQEIAQQNVHPVEGSTFQVISDGGGPHDLVAVYSGDKQFVGDTARVPLVAFVPVQLPEAVHEVALVEDQVTVEILLALMLGGLADNTTVGNGTVLPPPWLLVA